MKNFLLRLLVRLFRKSPNPTHQRILIISTTALGDTLWAAPAIESLRQSCPAAYIAVLTSPTGQQVLAHNPHIDRIYPLKLTLLPTLIRERFDTVLLFHASQRIALPLAALLGATRIIGTMGLNKGLDDLLTHPLPNIPQHEITRRLQIISAYGATPTTQTLSFYLQPHEQLSRSTPSLARPSPHQNSILRIALHPGSKDPYKRWPSDQFIQLGRKLKQKYDCELWITAAASEATLAQHVAANIPEARLAPQDLPLRAFAAFLNEMDLLICNDTGPFHLACALNRQVIGIYAATDPALCGPHRAPNARVIARRPCCTPCLKRKCRQPFCLLQIGVHEVLAAIETLQCIESRSLLPLNTY